MGVPSPPRWCRGFVKIYTPVFATIYLPYVDLAAERSQNDPIVAKRRVEQRVSTVYAGFGCLSWIVISPSFSFSFSDGLQQ